MNKQKDSYKMRKKQQQFYHQPYMITYAYLIGTSVQAFCHMSQLYFKEHFWKYLELK